MTEDTDKHGRFLALYVEHEQALRGFVRSLVPTLEDAREVMRSGVIRTTAATPSRPASRGRCSTHKTTRPGREMFSQPAGTSTGVILQGAYG
jgi:hypothetical protein